jgi:hypothetical protein
MGAYTSRVQRVEQQVIVEACTHTSPVKIRITLTLGGANGLTVKMVLVVIPEAVVVVEVPDLLEVPDLMAIPDLLAIPEPLEILEIQQQR